MRRRGLRLRARRVTERETTALASEEKAAAQRVAMLFGLCPHCFDDLPPKGTHVCAAG